MRIGNFNLKNDSKEEIVDTFHAFVENLLQSHELLDLKDPSKIFIRVLSKEHMQAINRRKRDLNNDINIINRGSDSNEAIPLIHKKPFMLNVSQDWEDECGKTFFEDYCLVSSVVLGNIFLI